MGTAPGGGFLKIALVTDRFGPGSGTAGQAFLVASALRARHDVTVWARAGSPQLEGVQVRTRRWFGRCFGTDGALWVAFDRVVGCDVVRASGGVHRSWLQASGRRTGLRDLVTTRVERAAAQRCRRMICNSEMVAADVIASHGIDRARVRVVRNGVDLSRFRPDPDRRARARSSWGVPDGGRVALFLAHGFRRKNLPTAAAAFAEVASPDDRLVVAGRDAQAARWLRAARAHVGDRLVVAGPLSVPEEVLPGADVLLHPTLYDAAANVVLEAMACGVPPVTTAADGASEIVENRSLVAPDPLDVRGVAAALDHAWQVGPDPAFRTAAAAWPVSRMVAHLEEVLLQVVADDS